MHPAANPLLRPGAQPAWAAIEAKQRKRLERPGETVEQRLIRGQCLSAQAARLRRSLRDDGAARTRP
jgi:hypothetical protein